MSRPATVPLVTEQDASPRVAAIFADIKQTKGLDRVPHFWRTLATQPDLLESVWGQVKHWMHPDRTGRSAKLDARTREIIAIAVSATNGCAYCTNSHTAALLKLGVDHETLGEVMAVIGLFNMTNSLVEAYQVAPDVFPSP